MKTKQTPEQKEVARLAHIEQLAVQAKRDAEFKAARRAQKRDEDAAYLAQMTESATKLAECDVTSEDPAERRLQNLKSMAGRNWLDAQAELAERAERLLAMPGYYFEWASSDMKCAARIELLSPLVASLHAKGEAAFAEVLAYSLKRATENLMSNYLSGNSTSAAHNAMQDARREASCHFISSYGNDRF